MLTFKHRREIAAKRLEIKEKGRQEVLFRGKNSLTERLSASGVAESFVVSTPPRKTKQKQVDGGSL